jgi:hypothetical protein
MSGVTLEQCETSSELNSVVVLDSLKPGVIEVQRSCTLAASSEVLGRVRDVGLIKSLQPSIVELQIGISVILEEF